jgi:hypothetical protein
MQTYALIRDGRVAEIIKVPANTAPIEERYTPEIVAACAAMTASQAKTVQEGWFYDGEAFAAPPPPAPPSPPPEPTKAELMAELQALMARIQALPD